MWRVCLSTAEMKKQREFYQKLGMEVPGDAKGELCSLKPPLDDQRNGTARFRPAPPHSGFPLLGFHFCNHVIKVPGIVSADSSVESPSAKASLK